MLFLSWYLLVSQSIQLVLFLSPDLVEAQQCKGSEEAARGRRRTDEEMNRGSDGKRLRHMSVFFSLLLSAACYATDDNDANTDDDDTNDSDDYHEITHTTLYTLNELRLYACEVQTYY